MEPLNRLLIRQLKRCGIHSDLHSIPEKYVQLFQQISHTYDEADKNHYTVTRSMEIASEEMFELRDKLKKEQDIIQSVISEGICIFDKNWKIIKINSTGAKLLSENMEHIQGKFYKQVFTIYNEEDEINEEIDLKRLKTQLKTGKDFHCDHGYVKTKTNIITPNAFSINPLPFSNHRFVGAIFIFRSIRKQIEADTALRNAIKVAEKSNQAKTIFLANMSHEIRTPLNGIVGMLQLLNHTPLNEKQTHYVARCIECANTLLAIIGDILDFAKIEAGRVSCESINFDLKSEIKNLIAIYQLQCERKNITLDLIFDEAIPRKVSGDILKIKQIFNNIFSNAYKFTAKNGLIQIRLSKVACLENCVIIKVSITDNGCGIPQTALKKVFEIFSQADESTTRQYGGTGLGLTITKQLVELMGGSIHVKSEVGVGSTFSFTLKLVSLEYQHVHSQSTLKSNAKNQSFNADVLVIEDNIINQNMIFHMLKYLGCKTDIAKDGNDALEKLKKNNYDLILMDCHMPDQDGFETTQNIRQFESKQNGKKNTIVALTANALQGTRERCLKSGMNDYLTKPLSINELKNILKKYCP